MKRFMSVVWAAAAALPLAAGAQQQGVTADTVTIGGFGPITGPAAYIGLAGRDGIRRFEPARDLPFPDAVARHLRALDPSLSANTVKDAIAGHDEAEVLKALHRTQQLRPDAPLAFLQAILRKKAEREVIQSAPRPRRPLEVREDPYA